MLRKKFLLIACRERWKMHGFISCTICPGWKKSSWRTINLIQIPEYFTPTPPSPDLNLRDFYLCVHLKDTVYKREPKASRWTQNGHKNSLVIRNALYGMGLLIQQNRLRLENNLFIFIRINLEMMHSHLICYLSAWIKIVRKIQNIEMVACFLKHLYVRWIFIRRECQSKCR